LTENSGAKVVKSTCGTCHCECGVFVHVKDNKVIKIEGDPNHPQNEGSLCPKGLAFRQLVHHPDRLKYPLKRVGERGENKWRRVSWDEAISDIAKKILEIKEKYGPTAIAWGIGDGDRDNNLCNLAWLFGIGSPHQLGCDATYCLRPATIADKATYGQSNTWEVGPDMSNSKSIMCWGANPFEAHLCSKGRELIKGLDRGARLIVVDARFTKTAAKADIWLQPRPATDAALALGMINYIIGEKLYDKGFVENHTFGFDQLKERAAEYPLERVSETTWVPAEKIRQAAKMFATFRPGCIYHRMGTNMNTNNVQTLRAIDCITGLLGNLDVKGGNLLPAPSPYPRPASFYAIQSVKGEMGGSPPVEVCMARAGAKEFPLNFHPESPVSWLLDEHPHMALDQMIEKKIRAIVWSNDPIQGLQNSSKVLKALRALDLVVVLDHFMTPTAYQADYVLPIATWAERDWVHDTHYINYVGLGQKAIDPPGEAKDEREIGGMLVKALGVKTFVRLDSIQQYNDWRLKPMDMTFENLRDRGIVGPWELKYRKYEEVGFQTESWKVEFYSNLLKKYGYDPLPHYVEPPDSVNTAPELVKDFPLIIISGGRTIVFLHSAHRNIPYLRELNPDPLIEIHPDTASSLGIKDGDWVSIETPFSRKNKTPPVKQRARLTRGIHPRVVHAQSHWWYPESEPSEKQWFEHNINNITTDQPPYDKISGSPLIRGGLCSIRRSQQEDRR